MPSPWHTNLKVNCALQGLGFTPRGVLPRPMRWRMAPLWQTSVELWARRHRAPTQDFTVSTLSQFLPVCCVTGMWREELASVTLAAPFPLTRRCECLFPPPVISPNGEPWWSSSSTPGSQTGQSSLTPGPVPALACPVLRSAPVLG